MQTKRPGKLTTRVRRASEMNECAKDALPCPFCGSLDIIIYDEIDIVCNDCSAKGPHVDEGDNPWTAWNKRTEGK